MLGHGGRGVKGRGWTHSNINYRTLNETPNARSQQFFENQLSMRSHTKSVCNSCESVHGEAMLKMGWMVKKLIFFFPFERH